MLRPLSHILAACLLAGCMKDGIEPPLPVNEGPVDLTVELMNGLVPFSFDDAFQDGGGNSVRITMLKFYISGVFLRDDDGGMVAGDGSSVLLMDGAAPRVVHTLGMMPNGHVHDINLTVGTELANAGQEQYPTGHPMADEDMLLPEGEGHLHLLLQGYVDLDGNALYDPGMDVLFDYRPHGNSMARHRHLHMHADMLNGRPLDLGLRVDLRLLVMGIDLLATPVADGGDIMAEAAMNGLVAAFFVRP